MSSMTFVGGLVSWSFAARVAWSSTCRCSPTWATRWRATCATDHRASASRRVFLRALAPHVGLSGPSVVGDIVCRRLARAKVQRSGRGAAHLFRHGLATQMIRHGASLAEIAEVLRHRSQTTTAIYTHVSFEALRAVARPWPPREVTDEDDG